MQNMQPRKTAGRPKLTERRKPRNIACYDDEFALVRRFVRHVREHPRLAEQAVAWLDFQTEPIHNIGRTTSDRKDE